MTSSVAVFEAAISPRIKINAYNKIVIKS